VEVDDSEVNYAKAKGGAYVVLMVFLLMAPMFSALYYIYCYR